MKLQRLCGCDGECPTVFVDEDSGQLVVVGGEAGVTVDAGESAVFATPELIIEAAALVTERRARGL